MFNVLIKPNMRYKKACFNELKHAFNFYFSYGH